MVFTSKRKAVAKSAGQLFKSGGAKGRAAAKKADPEEEPVEAEEQADEEMAEDPAAEEEGNEEVVDEEAALAQREAELTAGRKKELKAMPVNDLKELVQSKGLETGKKEDMVEAVLAHEAEVRAKERVRQAEIREVVVGKKDELEGLSVPELKELCDAAGAKGPMTKQARVELLMKRWMEDDGVVKAIAKKARDAREQQLASMDKAALRRLCASAGVEPLVKEVMVERIVRKEGELGRFARPKPEDEVDEESAGSKKGKTVDMVEALLANEANRKREQELKKQEEDAAANKRKELRAMSVEELKKQLSDKGQEPTGKKEELVEALFAIGLQEEAAAAKKNKLKSLSIDELKQRVMSRGLEPSNKLAMVDSLLKHEAELQEKAQAYGVKVNEALEKKKVELEEKTAVELKELCASRSLKLGVGKQERVETLLEDARTNGEVDRIVASAAKEARKGELLAMELAAVLGVCESMDVDPTVKEVALERLLSHEDEHGPTQLEEEGRPAKRARTAGKK